MMFVSGVALNLVLVALFLYALYFVVHKAVLNALRVHAAEQRPSTEPGHAGPPG